MVSNFILQALQGKDLTIYGNGMQTRSFQYVDDLIRGMERMMSTPDNFTGPVNLGNPEEHTILEFAQQIIELTGSRSRMVLRPLPADDPKRRNPDITLARQALDWHPRISLREGLQQTIAYYRNLLAETHHKISPNHEQARPFHIRLHGDLQCLTVPTRLLGQHPVPDIHRL